MICFVKSVVLWPNIYLFYIWEECIFLLVFCGMFCICVLGFGGVFLWWLLSVYFLIFCLVILPTIEKWILWSPSFVRTVYFFSYFSLSLSQWRKIYFDSDHHGGEAWWNWAAHIMMARKQGKKCLYFSFFSFPLIFLSWWDGIQGLAQAR
jgi:hypothetical protein